MKDWCPENDFAWQKEQAEIEVETPRELMRRLQKEIGKLYSDYAALEASHAALREAVARMFAAEDDIIEDAQVMPDSYVAARAEVDRLLKEIN